jgi:hypothetical protein
MKWRGDEEIIIRNDGKEQSNDTILKELSQLTNIPNYFTTIEANQIIPKAKLTEAIDTDNRFRPKPIFPTQLWIFLESLKTKGCNIKRKKKKRQENKIYSGEEDEWKNLIKRSVIKDYMIWLDHFEDFIAASLPLLKQ